MTEIGSGTSLTIPAGETSDGLLVDSGGFLFIDNGGSATNAIVGGNEVVSGGGYDSGAQVSGGEQDVFGFASGTTIDAGLLAVEAGGIALGITEEGGSLQVSPGGTIGFALGQTPQGFVVNNSVTLEVLAGDTASGVVVLAGGIELVTSGASDAGAQISGGEQDVFGSADGAIIYAGLQAIEAGGVASTTTIIAGGLETVFGSDVGAQVSGGEQDVVGSATSATIYAGSQVVSQGGVAFATVISGGELDVFGTASGTTLSAGTLVVESGAVVLGLTQSDGGLVVSAGGTVGFAPGQTPQGFIVSSGVTLDVVRGDTASGVIIAGGTLVIQSGASAQGTVETGGSLQVLRGGTIGFAPGQTPQGFVVSGGVTLDVASGDTASGVTIAGGAIATLFGGTEHVAGGASDVGAQISGTQIVFGSASGATIYTGSQIVSSGGATDATIVSAGGREFLYANGTAIDTVIYGISSFASGALPPEGDPPRIPLSLAVVLPPPPAGDAPVALPPPPPAVSPPPPPSTISPPAVSPPPPPPTPAPPAASPPPSIGAPPGPPIVPPPSTGGRSDPVNAIFARQGGTITISGGQDVISGATASGAVLSGGYQYVAGSASGTIITSGIEYVASGGVASATTISGGIMWLAAGGTASDAITFAGGGGTLQIDGTSMPVVTISGFVPGDMLDLADVPDSGGRADLLPGNTLQITSTLGKISQQYDLQLDPNQNFAGDFFHVAPDGGIGTLVFEDDVPCYCAGTRIATARGDVPVEELVIADRVLTLDGGPRPIKWIGRRSYRQPFLATSVMPILIKAAALGENVPQRDLYVSPEHAMYLDEVLVPAERLVNGVSVLRCTEVEEVHYFHVELDSHDVIFAEGAAAESFVDCDSRLMFHNAAEFNALYPGDTSPTWTFCAPRLESGPVLERIRDAIAPRAGLPRLDDVAACGLLEGQLDDANHELINGWAFDEALPHAPVWLEVLVDDGLIGRVLANRYRTDVAAMKGDGHHGFALWLQHPLSPLKAHVIRVRRAADHAELPGSPRVVNARGAATLLDRNELLLALQAAAQAARSKTDLDELLRNLQHGSHEVRQLRAEWRLAEEADKNDPARLLRWSERGPTREQRALVIDDVLPDPKRDAGSNAVIGHMRALMDLGFAVEFVAARQIESGVGEQPPRRDLKGVRWHCAPAVSSVEEVLRRNAGKYALIYLHRLNNAQSYAPLARRWCPDAQLVYSMADLHHLRLMRQARVQGLPKLMAHAQSVKQAELLAARTVNAVITHSLAEAKYLATEVPGVPVHIVPWPVAIRKRRQPPFTSRTGVAFIGGPGHDPNADAAVWLIEEIMPRVWRHDPTITCHIIGAGWSKFLKGRYDRRIRLSGSVPDLRVVLDRVRLTVAPLRFGAGIKGKVLDSFATGLPCVMTPIAAEGLPLVSSLRELIGETPDQFANLMWRLHKDVEFNSEASAAGLRFVARHFSAEQVRGALQAAVTRSEMPGAPTRPKGVTKTAAVG